MLPSLAVTFLELYDPLEPNSSTRHIEVITHRLSQKKIYQTPTSTTNTRAHTTLSEILGGAQHKPLDGVAPDLRRCPKVGEGSLLQIVTKL